MLGRVFRYQGGLWRALNTLTDIMALSVLWLLCSLPVLTLGAATTALYDSVVRCIRYKQPKPYARFFRTFKNELIPGILLTLMWGAAAALGLQALAAAAPVEDGEGELVAHDALLLDGVDELVRELERELQLAAERARDHARLAAAKLHREREVEREAADVEA